MKHRISLLLACMLAITGLVACGDKSDKKAATQVAAKVGSEEISVHQINQVLSRTNAANANPQQVQALRKDVLEKLIDQQLAVDQAVEAKLHRSPEIVAQIEAARRDVLARAYVQQLLAAQPKPTPEETRKYFAEHPALFSERRVFNLQEIIVPASAGPEVTAQVKSMAAAGKPMEEIAAALRAKNIKFGGGSATRAAEQIPLELLNKIHALKDGQTTVIDGRQGFTVVRLAASQSAPVGEAAALPRIEQFLSNQRGAETVSQQMKQLRAKATISYMGDFAQAAGAATAPAAPTAITGTDGAAAPAAAAPAAPATPAATTGTATAPAAPVNPNDPKTRSVIEKGVAAMK